MTTDVLLPDTGSSNSVDVIEVHVKPGDQISKDQTLITLESDKATIDVPSPESGIVEDVLVKVGSKIKTADPILKLKGNTQSSAEPPRQPKEEEKTTDIPVPQQKSSEQPKPLTTPTPSSTNFEKNNLEDDVFAGPAVRRLARMLGVDLSQIKGTGEKNRISKDDVKAFVKQMLTSGIQTAPGSSLLPNMPEIDFAQWGTTKALPLNKIKRLTAQNLSRNWLLAPHVTQFAEADITALEAFRKKESLKFEKEGGKLTLLAFLMKTLVSTLQKFPQFNASLDHKGENLIFKEYYHLGIAVDTAEGLVVPVIRDVDKKSLGELAKELAEISVKAREKKLTPQDMQGSTFTISSLGGIGGTAFTPIINLPNVAILGVSKAQIKPHYDGQQFQPRLMLPLSLSYDHRVIDGAEAARFCVTLSEYLADLRKILL